MSENKYDLLHQAVEKIAISAEDAHALVDNYKRQARLANPSFCDSEIKQMIGSKVIDRYAKLAAASGAATASAGIIPGVGTAVAIIGGGLADAAAAMKLQVDMTMCIAATYDYDLTNEDAKHLSFLIAGLGAVEQAATGSASKFASKASVKMIDQYLKGATLIAIKEIFKKFGIEFTKAGLKKALPFGIGVAISSSTNYALTQYVGKQALEWFTLNPNRN
ncbi:MAG: hypothetical protein RR944_09215 [Acinetobacter sp.]|uniref:hypothetical protein n=1 Tax=Acinetobacter sp. TaxID=472 RepID=UPI002FC6D4B9